MHLVVYLKILYFLTLFKFPLKFYMSFSRRMLSARMRFNIMSVISNEGFLANLVYDEVIL